VRSNLQIIYQLIDFVKDKLNQIIKPEIKREDLGRLQIFDGVQKRNQFHDRGRQSAGRQNPAEFAGVRCSAANNSLKKGKSRICKSGNRQCRMLLKGKSAASNSWASPLIEVNDILEIYKERVIKKII